MAATTYFNIQLPGANSQDWITVLNRAFSAITEKMVLTQLPDGATVMRWGDIAGGKYLEVSASGGVRVVGGADLGATPTKNLRVQQGEEFPTDYWLGMLFLRTDTETLYFRGISAWVEVGTLDVAVAGGLLVEDLGATRGSMAVSNGTGSVANVVPGANKTVLVSDSGTASGWNLSTVLALLGFVLGKGGIPIGMSGNAGGVLAPGSNGELLVADSGEAKGARWSTISDILETIIADHGALLVMGSSGPTAVDAPTADAQVLVSDAAEVAGVKWVNQSELGALPGARTRVAADLFLHANYI